MKKDNFDEILEKSLKEYVIESEKKNENVPKIRFSKKHEKNMEKIFKAVENGNLNEIKEDKTRKVIELTHIKKNNYMKYIKIAIFVLVALVASIAIAPSMKAWRTEDLSVYRRSRNDYAWLLNNDKTETMEGAHSDYEEYMEAFGYLPDGFEIESVVNDAIARFIKLKNLDGKEIILKINENFNNAVDFEEDYLKKIETAKFEVLFFERKTLNIYVWQYDEKDYFIYTKYEFDEIIKIIENMNFEKF